MRSLALLAALALATPSVAAPWPICDRGQPSAACVVDGDTVHLDGDTIRLRGLSAPETDRHRCPAELALGRRATTRLAELLGAGVRLVTDDERDIYGRLLADLVTPAGDAATLLIAERLARPWAWGHTAREADRRAWCGE